MGVSIILIYLSAIVVKRIELIENSIESFIENDFELNKTYMYNQMYNRYNFSLVYKQNNAN